MGLFNSTFNWQQRQHKRTRQQGQLVSSHFNCLFSYKEKEKRKKGKKQQQPLNCALSSQCNQCNKQDYFYSSLSLFLCAACARRAFTMVSRGEHSGLEKHWERERKEKKKKREGQQLKEALSPILVPFKWRQMRKRMNPAAFRHKELLDH